VTLGRTSPRFLMGTAPHVYENAILSGFIRPNSGRDTLTALTGAIMIVAKNAAASEQHVKMI